MFEEKVIICCGVFLFFNMFDILVGFFGCSGDKVSNRLLIIICVIFLFFF